LAAVLSGVTLDTVNRVDPAAGPRAAYLIGVGFFVLSAVLLRPVDPTRREH
jgi:hypothetical protein